MTFLRHSLIQLDNQRKKQRQVRLVSRVDSLVQVAGRGRATEKGLEINPREGSSWGALVDSPASRPEMEWRAEKRLLFLPPSSFSFLSLVSSDLAWALTLSIKQRSLFLTTNSTMQTLFYLNVTRFYGESENALQSSLCRFLKKWRITRKHDAFADRLRSRGTTAWCGRSDRPFSFLVAHQ